MQTIPISIDSDLLKAMSGMPSPATTEVDANGFFVDSSAMRTLDVANGQCTVAVPGRADSVFTRLAGGETVDVEIDCTYYCALSCLGGAPCPLPSMCLNELEPMQALTNNGYLPKIGRAHV